jgi:hypothetical protein
MSSRKMVGGKPRGKESQQGARWRAWWSSSWMTATKHVNSSFLFPRDLPKGSLLAILRLSSATPVISC